MDYKWKSCYSSIELKVPSKMVKLIDRVKQCHEFALYEALNFVSYRLYRRGKNRCKYCGRKHKVMLGEAVRRVH